MHAFPAFYPLEGKTIVIAGDGEPADAKARLFAGSPARVLRLTHEAALSPQSYAGADLIFVASFDAQFRTAAASAARACGAPLNVADAPQLSDFHTPAIIDRGQIVAAIGTAGASPLMASLLRTQLETLIPEGAGQIATLLGEAREAVAEAFPDLAQRRAFLRLILSGPAPGLAQAGDMDLARESLRQAIAEGLNTLGRVSFIDSGGPPDLISLRAARVLNLADVVFADESAQGLLAHHARRDAERRDIIEATTATMADLARAGQLVAVMAQMADPVTMAALQSEGITVEHLRPVPNK